MRVLIPLIAIAAFCLCPASAQKAPPGAKLPVAEKRALLGKAYAWAKTIPNEQIRLEALCIIGRELRRIGEDELAGKMLTAALKSAVAEKPKEPSASYERHNIAWRIARIGAGCMDPFPHLETRLKNPRRRATLQAWIAEGLAEIGETEAAEESAQSAIATLTSTSGDAASKSNAADSVGKKLARAGFPALAGEAFDLVVLDSPHKKLDSATSLIRCGLNKRAASILEEIHAGPLPTFEFNSTKEVLALLTGITTKERCGIVFDEALARVEKEIADEEKRSDTLWLLADAALAIPDVDRARKVEELLEGDDGALNANAKLAIAYAKVGAIPEAEKALAREGKTDWEADARIAILEAATKAGDRATVKRHRPKAESSAAETLISRKATLSLIASAAGDWDGAAKIALGLKEPARFLLTAMRGAAAANDWKAVERMFRDYAKQPIPKGTGEIEASMGDVPRIASIELAAHDFARLAVAAGELTTAQRLIDQIDSSTSHHGHALRRIHEKRGASLSPKRVQEALARSKDPTIKVSLVIGHLAGAEEKNYLRAQADR